MFVNTNGLYHFSMAHTPEVVKELIQKDLTVANMVSELDSVLSEEGSAIMKQNYKYLKDLLGGVGASERISSAIVSDLKSKVKSL